MTAVPRREKLFEVFRSGSYLGLLRSERFEDVTGDEIWEKRFRKISRSNGATGFVTNERNDDDMNLTKELTAAHLNGLKSSIHALEVQVTILKQLIGGKVSKMTEADDEGEENEDEEDDDFGGKAAKGKKSKATKKAKGFDEDEDAEEENEEESEDDAEEDEDEGKSAKGKKGKKLTVDDVNDACMELAEATDRKKVLGILKKKFKVASVTDLEPDQYAAVIKAMKAAADDE